MNKLFSKVAALSVGLAMAIGVGVAVGSKSAVRAKAETVESVTFSEQGYSNQQAIESYEGTNFTLTFDKGTNSNPPKYFTSGTAIRAYGGNTITATSSESMSKIVIGFGGSDGSNTISTDVGTYASGTWTGSSDSVTFTIGGTTGNRRLASFTVTIGGSVVQTYTITYNPNGGVVDPETQDVEENTTVTSFPTPAKEDCDFKGWKINGQGEYVTSLTVTGDVTLVADWSAQVIPTGVVDTLNREFTGITGTSYAGWTGKVGTSGTTYAGNSAGGQESIQIRSSNSNSGIVVTNSVSNALRIKVSWNASTAKNRRLDIFGKNTAYEAATDLYDSSKRGDLLASFYYLGVSSSITLDDDYAYIGIKSVDGAAYLDHVDITWEEQAPASHYTVTYNANGGSGSMTDATEYEPGATVTVLNNEFEPEGAFYEFDSFNTAADGSGTKYLEEDTFEISEDVTLYAQWIIKDVVLPNGSYSSSVPYTNPMPGVVDIFDVNDFGVGLLELDNSNVTYKDNYKEFDLAANKSLVITNHSNATITTIQFKAYKFDNIDVFVDGSTTAMHEGDGQNHGDPYVIELAVNATSTVEIKCNGGDNGSRSQSFYSFEVAMRVGSEPIHPSKVELNATSGNVFIGKTRQLTATVSPVDADDKSVTWTSSNPSAVTVDQNGLLTGVAAGSSTITVTTNDGGLTATFAATVKTLSYGTLEAPLSPEEAREVLDLTGSAYSAEKLYVKGVVYSSSYNSNYSNYTIWLKNSDGSENQYFELYATEIDSSFTTDYTAQNALKDLEVVCYGYGQVYSSIYELNYKDDDHPTVLKINYSAATFAAALLSETKATCDAYTEDTDYDTQKAALEAIWESLEPKYDTLLDSEKLILAEAERDEKGNQIEQAMARYDFLAGKYELENFITGRSPMAFVNSNIDLSINAQDNNTMIIVIAIAATSVLSLGLLLVLKKKKHN